MSLLNEISLLTKSGKLTEALELLNNEIAKNDSDKVGQARLLFERGKINWRLGNRGRATSDYMAAADLDPESPAVQALEQASDIEAFFNPDLLNP